MREAIVRERNLGGRAVMKAQPIFNPSLPCSASGMFDMFPGYVEAFDE